MSPPVSRNVHVERCSTIRGCEPCKRRKRVCNGQRPCANCTESSLECVYSVVSDYSRSVFTTHSARRLSSGSACETCRRRKTKCDGGNPCAYCVNAGFECNNNADRRKRNVPQQQQDDAMDRIEDRLRRIEKLMTAFTPTSPLSKSFTPDRKLSSPHPTPPTSVRPHRHSVQGISVAKEQAALRSILKGTSPPSSPPLSPKTITSSMLNLSLSPSSSTSSSQSNEISGEWKSSAPIPSLMDQLSRRTFIPTAMDCNAMQFPIYPISTTPKSTTPDPQNDHCS
ncbi:hypothetical protein BJV82DRAFT_672948 [Fennellomyces sp. T-0311]|nr:hypothetical protein BJV82DRAFT_672948 [Fennellomyces sp. T-0311]